MKEFYLPSLLELSKELGRLVRHYELVKPTEQLAKGTQEKNNKIMLEHAESFGELDLRMCKRQCERIAESMGRPVSEISGLLSELQKRMEDECALRKFIALSVKQAEFVFPNALLFGDEVSKKYPSAAFEIEEAARCLGLMRPTAAVFHLMRTMEIGLRSTASCLGISSPTKDRERNWGAMLKAVSDELKSKSSATPSKWINNDDKEFFAGVYAALDAVRAAWRNPTMHVESKYSDEEAEQVWLTVRAFMNRLASRCDETGAPKA